jgi:hypothetical protein
MNTHVRNPSYKLTMISFMYMGKRMVEFVNLPVIDGKVKVSEQKVNDLCMKLKIPNHSTFTVGA